MTFPAGKVVPRITRSTVAGEHLLVADPVLDGGDGAVGERVRGRGDRAVGVHRLGRDDAEVAGRQLGGVGGRAHLADDVARAGQAQPVAVDRVDVVAREVVGPDLDVVERAEIGREQRADGAAADDADLHSHEASLRLDQPVQGGVQRDRDAERGRPRGSASR